MATFGTSWARLEEELRMVWIAHDCLGRSDDRLAMAT